MNTSGTIRLPPDEAHLWYVLLEEAADENVVGAYLDLLSDDEKRRYHRFFFDKDRHLHLVSHALLRTVLSLYSDVHPAAWRFETNEYGRPFVTGPKLEPPISFNLSHTGGCAVCALAADREVGVDVEDTSRSSATAEIANRYFSVTEAQALNALPKEEQRRRFFQYWTLKESYIKARGMGLSIPLKHFTFHLASDQDIRISMDDCLDDDPATWQFGLFQPTDRHQLAWALRVQREEQITVRLRKTIP